MRQTYCTTFTKAQRPSLENKNLHKIPGPQYEYNYDEVDKYAKKSYLYHGKNLKQLGKSCTTFGKAPRVLVGMKKDEDEKKEGENQEKKE